jgi:hypothetical protein
MRWVLLCILATSACGDPVEDRPATWSYISTAIIQPNCATSSCHSTLTSTEGLRLDTVESGYSYLVGGVSTEPAQDTVPQNFVVPFRPQASKLLYLLRGQEVRRMPPDSPLPDGDIELIERWILEGAENN